MPAEVKADAVAGRIHILRTETDWGPATKLIPALLVETDPATIVVTLDDDIDYPSCVLEDLFRAAARRPDAALGFKGYWLPPPPGISLLERCDGPIDAARRRDLRPLDFSHVDASRRTGYYSHENLKYVDAIELDHDAEVDVLGGLLGVAYRSGFFDLRRLVDYGDWPGGAFFVDDDWISLVYSRRERRSAR